VPVESQPPGRVLISTRRLATRVRALGLEISRAYRGRPLTVLGLMNGSIFFMVDLLRRLPPGIEVECWRVASYQGTRSTGKLRGLAQCTGQFRGRDVLIIDDIHDTGLTLEQVRRRVRQLGARSVKTCVLLEKDRPSRKTHADWAGFRIPDRFVIGYGLDLDQRYRSLPMIRVLD
jgi:hypoxanthine phosphoribosyltransferase